MDFVVKKGEIVLLDNDEAYQIVETLVYEGESYLFALKVAKNLNEVFDVDSKELKVLKEIVTEEKEYFLEEVIDTKFARKLGEELKNKSKNEPA